MQVLVQLEPVTTLVDPVRALRLVQEVPGSLQHHDVLAHVLLLAVLDILVRRSVVPQTSHCFDVSLLSLHALLLCDETT